METLRTGSTRSTCSEGKPGMTMSSLWMMRGLLGDSRFGGEKFNSRLGFSELGNERLLLL